MKVENIPIDKVRQFSNRDFTYYNSPEKFKEYINYLPSLQAFPDIINSKSSHPIDRDLLHHVVAKQYETTNNSAITRNNLNLLREKNTFTVTTAHQPSLLTGPLYYVFKILSTINLAHQLNDTYTDYKFVPTFIIGSEDHDFEEINHLNLYGKQIVWNNDGKGPVGHFTVDGLKEVISETSDILGNKSLAIDILNDISNVLNECNNYQEFAFKLTHRLFDHLGLLIVIMDNAKLKKAFTPIIKEEILEGPSQKLVHQTQIEINKHLNFQPQAHARPINFFYTGNGERNRVILENGTYHIDNTSLTFSRSEIVDEIEQYPERFSPNVVMRPLYQESILPNLAYIGGGGELAYWTERKSQFDHFGIPMPALIRRQSGMILTPSDEKSMSKLDLTLSDIFQDKESLVDRMIQGDDHPEYFLDEERQALEEIFSSVEKKVIQLDGSLKQSVGSEKTKLSKSLDYLENKMKKALKQKESVSINRLDKLQAKLFPNGLQERHDNIFQYISQYGEEIIDQMLPYCNPLEKTFKVFRSSP